jgi:hypothetical protein
VGNTRIRNFSDEFAKPTADHKVRDGLSSGTVVWGIACSIQDPMFHRVCDFTASDVVTDVSAQLTGACGTVAPVL